MAISRHKVAVLLVSTLLGGSLLALPVGAQTLEPSVDIEKLTNGTDADAPPGPTLAAGDPVTWTYLVTNDGEVPLTDVAVSDDQGVTVTCPATTLAVGASMECTGSGLVYPPGVIYDDFYRNVGTVTGTAGDVQVTDSDGSHYTGALQCRLSGDHVVFIGAKLTNRPAERSFGPISVSIPPGVYRVTMSSYDYHSLKLTQVQPQEQWFVELIRPGASLYTSPPTPDLPFEDDLGSWTVDDAAVVGETATALFARHLGFSQTITTGVNSVDAICVAFSQVEPEIDIRKQEEGDDTRQVVRGSDVVFEIQVTNTGVIDLQNVAVSDPDYPQCDNAIGDLAAGSSVTYECTVSDVQSDFTNVATVTGDSDFGSATDEDPSTLDVLGPSIDVRKQDEGPDQRIVAPGSDVDFEIEVTNDGDVDLQNVAVSDPDYPQCDNVIGDLAIGASVSYTCTVSDAQADFTNTVTATGESATQEGVEDSDPSTIVVSEAELVIDLELTKEVDLPLVTVGQAVVFTVTVVNQGPDDATGVEVTDTLPAGVSYVSHSGDGTYNEGTGVWVIGDLAVGDSVSLDITVTGDAVGIHVNEAEVTAANEPDADSVPGDGTGDDWDDASVEVVLVQASGTIGDTVWRDSDGDAVQDSGEPGIAGVTVQLTNTGTGATQTQVTNSDGLYLFSALDAGDYVVEIDMSTAPADHSLTTPGSFTVALGEGESFLDADFGLQPGEGELPVTGFSVETFGLVGLAILALGAALVGTSRRLRVIRLY